MTNNEHESVDAHIIGEDSVGIAVEVTDCKGYTNHVLFDRGGELIGHVHERFTEATQTDPEPARLLKRVQFRARNEAHRQTEADLLLPILDWTVIEDTIDILESFDVPQIMEHFEDFYEAIQDPPAENVAYTALFLFLNDGRDELVRQSDPVMFYHENDDLSHTEFSFWRDPDAYVTIPPLEEIFACDKRFRDLIVHQLKCRIRDLHYMQGCQPPEKYRVDGLGVNDSEIVPFNEQAK
ncbi:hypothetical protein [Halobiforma nitratireducens]|uniref:hypothetical protein n=1 Tax=Halobiforma nitratireducens TaxID=130048 RepID=UPI0018727FC4|nr:hypothetical protein [Halobiforma nitratireducens]